MSKETRSIRFDPEHLAIAEEMGIDINTVCRRALQNVITPGREFTMRELFDLHKAVESCHARIACGDVSAEPKEEKKWKKLLNRLHEVMQIKDTADFALSKGKR